ncbi:MAG: OmpA/MotB family protein [Candidatus Omnitrophota bacterium]|jgi:flagellar motor protein MotB
MPVSRSFGGSVPQTGVLKKWVVTPKMSGWCVGFPKGVFFCGVVLGVLFCLTGCKTTDTQCQRISRQQALTIEGLNSEILRLNQEIDTTIGSRASLEKVQAPLASELSREIGTGVLTVSLERKGLVIRILESALFEPDQIDISDSATSFLDPIATYLSGHLRENQVIIEGHLDGPLPDGSGWRSGWEYTQAIAVEVVHYFVDVAGLNSNRFAVAAFNDHCRLNLLDRAGNRARNRRVEIVIVPKGTNVCAVV